MTAPAILDIRLHEKPIGTITWLEGDASIFRFNDAYLNDPDRATLSLAYKDSAGGIIDKSHVRRTRIEPFFSNLLPEGALRDFFAARAGVKSVRDFPLLAQLGQDLPGAVKAIAGGATTNFATAQHAPNAHKSTTQPMLRFSLAGVQLKFSALKNNGRHGGLTIPANGAGGDWIVKLPSAHHSDVPQAEYAAMALAQKIGIDVPDIDLIPIDDIEGLPENIAPSGTSAFAIRRFDRTAQGAVHIEDFAQLFNIYAHDKYEKARYSDILSVLAQETTDDNAIEFIRRLTYSVLIGNGDMHLKNWSLIYPDQRRPKLAPAYDLLSTQAYIRNDPSALKIGPTHSWADFTLDRVRIMADHARLPSHMLVATVQDVVTRFDTVWEQEKNHLPFPANIVLAVENHRKQLNI